MSDYPPQYESKKKEERFYAVVKWHARDAMSIFPHLNEDEAEEFLANNEKYIAECLTEQGFSAIRNFGDMDMDEGVLRKEGNFDAICENCGRPAHYDPDYILCGACIILEGGKDAKV